MAYYKNKSRAYMPEELKNIPKEDIVRGMKDQEVPLIEIDEYTDEQMELDLKDLYSPNSPYSPEQKIQAVNAYMVTGTSIQAQKYCGVTAQCIRDWKKGSSWWPEVMAQVKKAKQDELDAMMTSNLHHAMHKISDRIENGDEKLQKDGSLKRVPIGGKDLAVIVSILYEKRALLRGDVTGRVENKSNNDQMKLLQSKFEDIAKQLEAKPINNTYSIEQDKGNG